MMDLPIGDLPEIHACLIGLRRKEEALLRRMLCAWDPAWGEPVLQLRQQSAADQHVPRWDAAPDEKYWLMSWIMGLGVATEIGHMADIRVFARDHIGTDGEVLAPIPDQGMLAVFEERLAKRPATGQA